MSANTEALPGAHGIFPLGAYRGSTTVRDEPAARPFGLRFAAPPQPCESVPAADFSSWDYDPDRQIAVVTEDGSRIEAAKHSTGPTQTPTNTGDGTRFERDEDVTED
ncbi:MAG: putative ATP-grasp-modified RiPP [Actinophytocola sp.]|uniref:putative ATP-grasp-modified RiPP n=1 Tax=Actinophytocola sp. TaxID=1872138 RepID=UPI001329A7A0|nr:putative ATP-grasp-modified RiPP [Actinophytocola sp.]MPZ85240.1 putative ATP-grasp-modified RiPP [Actinophytocola sp.]